jgi:acetyl esterase/lipase
VWDVSSPVILVLPGGGYASLAPHEGVPVLEWLESLGWRARVVEYPVLTRHPGPLDAVQAVVREERANGAPIVGTLGFSAGGHLAGHAALVGTGDSAVDFAVLCYPVVNMLTETHAGSRENLIGLDAPDALRQATSLQLLVTPESPSMFIWSTTDDASVPIADHTYALGEALAHEGVPHDFHIFDKGGAHGMGLGPGTLTGEQWTRLAGQWLAKKLP